MRIGFCGLGLIGSSLARVALAGGHQVVALDPDPEARVVAADLGAEGVDSPAGFAGCDLLALSGPTSVNVAVLRGLMADGPRVPCFDIGSVKTPITAVWAAEPAFPFVGTHPMAGSEKAGAGAGTVDLFRGAAWPVVVDAATDADTLAAVIDLITAAGAVAVPVTAAEHDRSVALVSHLPHVMAATLGAVVAESPERELALRLVAGSFRDATRVAGSPPERTAEFVSANAPDAAAVIREAARTLAAAAELVADQAALTRWLAVAHSLRAGYPDRDDVRDVAVADPVALRSLLLDVRDSGAAVVAHTPESVSLVGGRGA